MHWRIKGVTQKALSVVPGGGRINDLLQRTIGELRHFDRQVASKINDDWVILVSHMHELKIDPRGLRYLEIGTGWYPTLPICYSLLGAASCATFDLVRHLSHNLTRKMMELLPAHLPAIANAARRGQDEVEADYQALKKAATVGELLRSARIEYHAPADASSTGLPPDSVDVVFSNSVLEHVPRKVIVELMRESHRIVRPGGLAIHSLNCGDHYAYFDHKITAINYLSYTEREWRFWNNDLQYQNRLRPQDYLGMAEEAGLQIVLKKQKPRQELLAALPRLRTAPEFQSYSAEELCTTSIDFVARKP